MRQFAAAIVLFLVVAGASGCGFIDYYFLPPPEDTAQELWEAGMDAMKDKDYLNAQDYFVKLKDKFPFSPYSLKGEIALADAYYLDKKYLEALDAYKEFEAMHPSNENIPYVLFQVGMSNFNMFKGIDRRQDNIKEGLEYFYRVEQSFPDSEYAAQARDYILKSRRILAEHELYVADFYWRTDRYGPAWNRYKYVVENFADVPDLRDYARRRAEYAYFEYQKTLADEERMRIQESWLLWLKNWL
ncbi:outer membrane protein assembly factor BamD [Pseudodesulfovibrio senegalensis]|uniref:Outer membrane protein assembly factor BamD n=1 Tax=Pseudodesulfovibrio senegalensis TaxID=1721087 RepID=A0A6N6N0X3_9BACT|nr:outer membrane protein assembly factor BamD [Pseudodesulfovibrio senegalensis]KAB1441215.1 outer membrane protein assembly factor BamD [Pseudodesulfovibrio senegalensis]